MRKIPWFALMLFLALCICCAQADVLTFPSDLTTIAEEAFAGDTSLDEAVLPERLNAIGRHAFAYSSLRRVYLPETLNSIGDDAFLGCQDLVAWGYPDTYGEEYCREKGIPYEAISTPAEEFAFSFPNDSEATVTGWMGEGETVIIPEMADETHRVTAIGNDAFRNNSALKKLYLPTGLVSIGDCAFRDCANLEDVVFHAGLKQIRQGAFCNCDKLRDADLPDSVEVIGGGYYGAVGAFQDCDALESFHYPSSLTDAPFYEVWRGNLANCPNLKTVQNGHIQRRRNEHSAGNLLRRGVAGRNRHTRYRDRYRRERLQQLRGTDSHLYPGSDILHCKRRICESWRGFGDLVRVWINSAAACC